MSDQQAVKPREYTDEERAAMPTREQLAHLNTFVVVCSEAGVWGSSKSSIGEALKNCRKRGARRGDYCVAYLTTEDFECGNYFTASRFINLGEI